MYKEKLYVLRGFRKGLPYVKVRSYVLIVNERQTVSYDDEKLGKISMDSFGKIIYAGEVEVHRMKLKNAENTPFRQLAEKFDISPTSASNHATFDSHRNATTYIYINDEELNEIKSLTKEVDPETLDLDELIMGVKL